MIARKLRYGRLFRSIIKVIPYMFVTEKGQLYIVKMLLRSVMWLCVFALFMWWSWFVVWALVIVLASMTIQNIDFHLTREKYTVELHTRLQRRAFFRKLKENGYAIDKKK